MTTAATIETSIKRDRMLVLAGLVGSTTRAWLYLFSLVAGMDNMGGTMGQAMLAAHATPWTATEFVLMFLM